MRQRFGDQALKAFFIGGGSYTVPRAWTGRDKPFRVTVAEIDPQVTVVAARDFSTAFAAEALEHLRRP